MQFHKSNGRNHEESHLSYSGSSHSLCFSRFPIFPGRRKTFTRQSAPAVTAPTVKVPQPAQKMGAPAFSSPTVQKMSDAELVDFIENGGPQKKATHAFANKGVSAAEAAKLAAYVKTLK